MNEKPTPKKPLIYYSLIALLILLLLNAFVFPHLLKRQVTQVDYGSFLSYLESGTISEVEVQDNQIAFMTKDSTGKETIFVTGAMADPELVNRLKAAGVDKYSQVIPKENSPLMNILLTWILPMILLFGLWMLLGNLMQKKMGGGMNAMTFGKSNAKIYVQAQTGKTFADVAGQDEAKEALTEIVDFLHDPSRYAAIGADLPKGALLVGPPGTG